MDLKTATDIAGNIATTLAIIVGGSWAYFKFIRGRTFARRAEITMTPLLEKTAGSFYLSVSIVLKNTGLSKLPLNPEMKYLRLFGLPEHASETLREAEWERIRTVKILDQHDWIEAQETVSDTVVFSLPASPAHLFHVAYRMDTIVGAPMKRITKKGAQWNGRAVIFSVERNNEGQKQR